MSNATTTSPLRKWAPLLEGGTLLLLAFAFNLAFFENDPGFARLSPHPMLMITLLILVRYGFISGVLVAGLGILLYGILLLLLVNVPTFFHLLSAPYSTPVVVLVPTTVILGLLSQRHLDRLATTEAERKKLAEENDALKQEQANLRDVNVELAGKVVGVGQTLSTLYRYAQDLNVTDVNQIYDGLTKMLQEVLEAEVVSVWLKKEGGKLLLATRSGDAKDLPALSIDKRITSHFDDHGVLALHDIPEKERRPGLPYLIGRITNGRDGGLMGYLTIDRIPFSKYVSETHRLFTMVVDWACLSIGNALEMEGLPPAEQKAKLDAVAQEQRAMPGSLWTQARGASALRALIEEGRKIPDTIANEETSFEGSLVPDLPHVVAPQEPNRDLAPPQINRRDTLVVRNRDALEREQTGMGLSSVLSAADRLLSDSSRLEPEVINDMPVSGALDSGEDPNVNSEVLKGLELTRASNAPLGELLGEIGEYLAGTKKD